MCFFRVLPLQRGNNSWVRQDSCGRERSSQTQICRANGGDSVGLSQLCNQLVTDFRQFFNFLVLKDKWWDSVGHLCPQRKAAITHSPSTGYPLPQRLWTCSPGKCSCVHSQASVERGVKAVTSPLQLAPEPLSSQIFLLPWELPGVPVKNPSIWASFNPSASPGTWDSWVLASWEHLGGHATPW